MPLGGLCFRRVVSSSFSPSAFLRRLRRGRERGQGAGRGERGAGSPEPGGPPPCSCSCPVTWLHRMELANPFELSVWLGRQGGQPRVTPQNAAVALATFRSDLARFAGGLSRMRRGSSRRPGQHRPQATTRSQFCARLSGGAPSATDNRAAAQNRSADKTPSRFRPWHARGAPGCRHPPPRRAPAGSHP